MEVEVEVWESVRNLAPEAQGRVEAEVWESVRNLAPEALRQAPTVTLMGRQQVDWFDNNVLTEAKRGLKGLWRTATAWTCTGIIASKRSAENIYGDASQTHPHTLITITHTHTYTQRYTHTRTDSPVYLRGYAVIDGYLGGRRRY